MDYPPVAQVLNRRKRRQSLGSSALLKIERSLLQAFASRQSRLWALWMMSGLAVVLLLVWNWKLTLATGTGGGVMWLVFVGQGWDWSKYWLRMQGFLKSPQRPLAIAVGSGGLAAVGTYLIASIWVNTENRWLATGAIAQGLGTLLTLGLLGWQMTHQKTQGHESRYERLLQELTQPDPLKRLIGVRQLTRLSEQLDSTQKRQLMEYFQLLLLREDDPTVRQGILDGLQQWHFSPVDAQPLSPLKMPLQFKVSRPLSDLAHRREAPHCTNVSVGMKDG
ncbi:hypothetical protein [Spirulina subsalsa]|uniref:hypothetical protein n=1 Tax=Spirulina subsalsa TaxID=54311 RepID=UPI0002DD9719|nr:hypothetical protein [Spirulina subsalsa]